MLITDPIWYYYYLKKKTNFENNKEIQKKFFSLISFFWDRWQKQEVP